MGFQNQLQYSSCSEDTASEAAAAQLLTDAPVITVSGGGGRAFGLVSGNRPVRAFDFNPQQIEFCRFKAAAMRRLSHGQFSLLMGLKGGAGERKMLLNEHPDLRAQLSRFSLRVRWRTLKYGALFSGRVEEHFVFGAGLLNRIYPSQMRRLLLAPDAASRLSAWRDLNSRGLWAWLTRQGSSPWVYRLFLRNIGWYNDLPAGFDVSKFVLGRIEAHLERFSILDSHVLQLVLYGRYFPELGATLPHYLTEDGFESIRMRIDQVDFVCSDIVSLVKKIRENGPVFISLSNVPAYLSRLQFEELWRAIAQNCSVGSVIVGRHFLRIQQIPPAVASQFSLLQDLTQLMNHSDRSFVYDLYAYQIVAGNP